MKKNVNVAPEVPAKTLAKHEPSAHLDFQVRTKHGMEHCSKFAWALPPGSEVLTTLGPRCVDDMVYAEVPNPDSPGSTYLQFWIGEELVKQSSVVTRLTFKE